MKLLIIITLFSSVAFAKNHEVSVLNWWDFIADKSINELKKDGFNIGMSIYKSNDVAVERLISTPDRFDVAIVSNQIIEPLLKAGVIERGLFKGLAKQRGYYPFITDSADHCVPYMWSTTLFAYNSSKPTKINTLNELLSLSKKKYNVGVLDDKIEVFTRLTSDENISCENNQEKNCTLKKLNSIGFRPDHKVFISSSYEVLKSKPSATYGWSGEAAIALKTIPNLRFSLPKERPVIGYDSVCIVKNKNSKKNREQLVKFVKTLTNKKNTKVHVKEFQYFSPYQGDASSLRPKTKSLLTQLLNLFKTQKPKNIANPSEDLHKVINIWWNGIRYEK